MSEDQPTSLKTLKIYWKYWMRHRVNFFGTLLMGPAFVLINVISPLFIAQAIGQLSKHHHVSSHYIYDAAISLIVGVTIWYLADNHFSIGLDSGVLSDMNLDSFRHLLSQEYGFFADNFTGSLVTQTNRFVKSYELFHLTFFITSVGQFSGVLVALGIMIAYNAVIGIAIALLWLFSVSLVVYLIKRRIPFRRIAVKKESQATGELADALTNATTIKTFAAEDFEQDRYDVTNTERRHLLERSWHIAVRNNAVVQLLCALLQISLFAFGVHAIENHSITIATYLLFQVYILVIINNVANTTLIARQVEGVLGDSSEMTLLFERQPVVCDPKKPVKSHIKDGAINFSNITFSYDEKSTNLFSNFDLAINPGERVGLVGPSGGGKTTITKLVQRFMDVQSGAITIDGQDIRAIKQYELHSAIGYVPQEPLLFHRTLLENISYGRPTASMKEIIAASKKAHADDFIANLPNGYDTLVGERGIKLSGGQRQRVAIARAMLKNAPILILDEATSALDSQSEKYIQTALWELMDGKTTLVIAHRLSTISRLDRIIVLDKGAIVESGSHTKLLKQNGLYATLWAHQSSGFMED